MSYWCAATRLIKTKCESGNFDCYTEKNWLGHEWMATTEGCVKHAEKYYRDFPVNWISCALKSPTDKSGTGMHKNKFYKREVQQNSILGSVDILPSCCQERAGRGLTRVTGETSRNRIRFLGLLDFQTVTSISLNLFFFLYYFLIFYRY